MLFQYPRAESNRHPENRNLIFYPLNYRGISFSRQKHNFVQKSPISCTKPNRHTKNVRNSPESCTKLTQHQNFVQKLPEYCTKQNRHTKNVQKTTRILHKTSSAKERQPHRRCFTGEAKVRKNYISLPPEKTKYTKY